MQFGAGSQLAAQCQRIPVPDGWRPWTDEDGPIPDALAQRAKAISDDQTVLLGATEGYPLPGVTVLIRMEPSAWARDAKGALIAGCFRAGTIYLPSGAPAGGGITPPETSSGLTKAIAILTVVSLAVGTIATVATWKKK